MPWQLIFTSVPRGLQPGRSGYCTAAQSSGIRPLLVQQLEQLSAYTHLKAGGRWPIVSAYRQADLSGQKYHVLTRIRDAGLDFSGRSNYLAHHLAFAPEEIAGLPSPAAILLHWNGWMNEWTGEPRLLPDLSLSDFQGVARNRFLPAHGWQSVAGDAGKAAALLSPQYARGCSLAIQPGQENILLGLYAESLQLLDPEGKTPANTWRHTFTTFVQGEDTLSDFRWRGGWPQTPGYEIMSQAGAAVLEPASVVAPTNELAVIAREGRRPIRVSPVEVRPAPPPPPLSPQAPRVPGAPQPPPSRPAVERRKPIAAKLRLAPRPVERADEYDDAAPPAAPRQEHPWRIRLFFALGLVLGALAVLLAYRHFVQPPQARPVQIPTDVPPASDATSAPPAAGTNPPATAQAARSHAEAPIWLFMGRTCKAIDLSKVPPLTNLVSQLGRTLFKTNIQCFILQTNQVALGSSPNVLDKGQPVAIQLVRAEQLQTPAFGLCYNASKRVEWLDSERREQGPPFTLYRALEEGLLCITLEWKEPGLGEKTSVRLALLNSKAGTLTPSKQPKELLLPDKSGLARYATNVRGFIEAFTLGPGLHWTLEPRIFDTPFYTNWIADTIPQQGDEINFAKIRWDLGKKLEGLTNDIANAQTNLTPLPDQELMLGKWLGVVENNRRTGFLYSFLKFSESQRFVPPDQPAEKVFVEYLKACLPTNVTDLLNPVRSEIEKWNSLGAQESDREKEKYHELRGKISELLKNSNGRGLCERLDARLKELRQLDQDVKKRMAGIQGDSPITRCYETLGSDTIKTCLNTRAKRAKLIETLGSLHQRNEKLIEQQLEVADGCWTRLTNIQLLVTDGKNLAVPFMVFDQDVKLEDGL